MGVQPQVVERATDLKMTILDYGDLKLIAKKLTSLCEDVNASIYKEAEEHVTTKVAAYLQICNLFIEFHID